MICEIELTFFLCGGQTVSDIVTYEKKSEDITDEDFEKDIEKICNQIKEELNNGLFSNNINIYTFGDTTVRVNDLNGYKIGTVYKQDGIEAD